MKTFAILMEPASYTIDRNRAVYDKLGIEYCYMRSASEASNIKADAICIRDYNFFKKFSFLKKVLSKYDCIIMNGYVSIEFYILFILNLFYKKPIGIDSDTRYSRPKSFIRYIIKRFVLKIIFSNKYIYGLAGGTQTHFDLFTKYGMNHKRVLLMPMMIDNDKFRDKEYLNKQYSPFTFLYVGRLIECKNLDVMFKAFSKLSKTNNNVKLNIVGGGILEDYYKKEYSNDNIIFKGKKFGNDLHSEYKSANAFILPSSSEEWGLVINEAMSAGLPVIVSNEVGAKYDLVDNKNTGFVFNYNSEDELYKYMCNIISDEKGYREMSNNAYNLMHNYWNYSLYEKCLKDFINISTNK